MLRFARYGLLMLFALIGSVGAAEDETKEPASMPAHRVVVYYLHNTWRCLGCNSVESVSKAAVLGGTGTNSKTNTEIEVKSPFPDDVEANRLSFTSVNIDAKENKELLKTLGNNLKIPVVAEVKDDTIVSYTPLADAWKHLGDNEAFVQYVQDGTKPMVKKVRPATEQDGKE